jgi:hypothetical protein
MTGWDAMKKFVLALAFLAATPSVAESTQEPTPAEVIDRALEDAGGQLYRYPGSYHFTGVYLDYRGRIDPVVHQPYELWRVQPRDHPRGRVADGKIRVSAFLNGKPSMQLAFDGAKTYDINGATGEGGEAGFWRTTMGFGMIRFALSPGYRLTRLADDKVDNEPVRMIRVTDPSGESAVFSVRKSDYRVVRVSFPTPRGLHERIFSEFFSKPGSRWVQPGRVRSFINGEKEAEFVWTDYEIGVPLKDDLFVIKSGQYAEGK